MDLPDSVTTATKADAICGNDGWEILSRTMGFLAVAGCMLLATAMSAALTTKPSKA
ncbi:MULTISPECIES: hypothetical protein [unclassified Synechococcus]|uniref:hypothetical protein n=1 Tax=unclassified Synechococcus TaxID=2626047 RepID=UPI001CF8CC71|nr:MULTISPECIES: hypothetical protein [unclassified Synechococcus]